MKSQNSIMSKVVLVVALFLTTFSGLHARQPVKVTKEQPLTSIRYIGKEDDLLIFDVRFSYNTEGRFRILDEYGNVLFDEKVQPRFTAKRFKIATQTSSKIHFESVTREQSQRKTFTVVFQIEERFMLMR